MLNPFEVLRIVIEQRCSRQTLRRTPEDFETSAVMDDETGVAQYDQAMQSKLAIVYAGALEGIHRSRRLLRGGRAIDLCCGPGHFTLLLAKYFDYEEVIGVDLSAPMIAAANRNAQHWGLADRVRFEVADATNYPSDDNQFDLVTCNDAAHHLPSLAVVERLLVEMERLASPNALIQLTDLVRLKTESITDRYTQLLGQDYLDRGLDHFQKDFCHSMRAAWTGDELRSSLPLNRSRRWYHRAPKWLPTVQRIVGYPDDGLPLNLRQGLPWSAEENPVPKEMRLDWRLSRWLA